MAVQQLSSGIHHSSPSTRYLFVGGRPGAGKSFVSRYIIQTYGGAQNVMKLDDYPLLWSMFKQQERGALEGAGWFRRTEKNGVVGFEITNRLVLPLALSLLDEQAHRLSAGRKLIILECARNDYRDIVKRFRPDILNNSHFLFVQAPIETCIQRIDRRVQEQLYPDDRLVPETVVRKHYANDSLNSLMSICMPDRLTVIHNDGQKQDTERQIRRCVDRFLYRISQPAIWSLPFPLPFSTVA